MTGDRGKNKKGRPLSRLYLHHWVCSRKETLDYIVTMGVFQEGGTRLCCHCWVCSRKETLDYVVTVGCVPGRRH